MGYRRSWEKAHSPYWSLHVEAWRRSGLSRTEYCRRHGLKKQTLDRWMKHLIGVEEARKHAEELRELRRKERRQRHKDTGGKMRQRRRFGVRTDARSRAVRAFWAMHVEALNWSGMSVRDYATALLLSPWSLRKWRDRLDDGEVEIDWRAHLHPSARPRISTSASDSAKGAQAENNLTAAPAPDPAPPGPKPRRSFTDAEKHAIVLETERPGVTVSQVARAHRIVTSMLFRWRAELGFGKDKAADVVAVRIVDGRPARDRGAGADAVVLQDILAIPLGAVAVELGDGRRVFAPAGSDPEAVRQCLKERQRNQAQTGHYGLRSGDLRTNRPSSCGGAGTGRAAIVPDSCSRSASGVFELAPSSCFDLAGNSALDQLRC
jgi:transposase-like protein